MSVAKSIALLLCGSLWLPAQGEAPLPAKAAARPPVVVTLSFPGGKMAQFVAAVRAAEPKANIVVATTAAGANVPPMELRAAGLSEALEGACAVAEADFQVRVADFKGGGEPVYSILAVPTNPATTTAVPAGRGKPDEGTQVFSLNRLTDADPRSQNLVPFKVETILSAIEAGTADDPVLPVLRFHRDSGLLFLRGTRAQIGFVKDLLSNLERDLEDRRQRNRPAKEAPKESAATQPEKGSQLERK